MSTTPIWINVVVIIASLGVGIAAAFDKGTRAFVTGVIVFALCVYGFLAFANDIAEYIFDAQFPWHEVSNIHKEDQ